MHILGLGEMFCMTSAAASWNLINMTNSGLNFFVMLYVCGFLIDVRVFPQFQFYGT